MDEIGKWYQLRQFTVARWVCGENGWVGRLPIGIGVASMREDIILTINC